MKNNKYLPSKMILGILVIFTMMAGCVTNGGVEVGNPDVTGKTLTIVTSEDEMIFVAEFTGPSEVEATQVKGEVFETVVVPYASEGKTIQFEAVFSDGTHLLVILEFNGRGEIISSELLVNGEVVEGSLEFSEGEFVCDTSSGNAAATLAQGLCSKIMECNTVFACGDCEQNVLVVPGLGGQFGAASFNTLEETADGIGNGLITVNETNLSACLADINIVPCFTVQKQFNDQDPPNYNQVKTLIPKPSCLEVLAE